MDEVAVAFTGIESTPPVVGVTTPSNGAEMRGSKSGFTLRVEGTASNVGSSVQYVRWALDSGPLTDAVQVDAGWARWRADIPLPAVSGNRAPHTITIESADTAGNASAPIAIQVRGWTSHPR